MSITLDAIHQCVARESTRLYPPLDRQEQSELVAAIATKGGPLPRVIRDFFIKIDGPRREAAHKTIQFLHDERERLDQMSDTNVFRRQHPKDFYDTRRS